MKIFFTVILLAVMNFQILCAKSINDSNRMNMLEEKCSVLQYKLTNVDTNLRKLTEKQNVSNHKMLSLEKENDRQRMVIDTLQNVCKNLENAQSIDRKNINGKIDATDNNVRVNQDMLQVRTLWGIFIVVVFLAIIVGIAYRLAKRIKSGNSTIGDVRKAQEMLQAAQAKMQEESIKLDNQLLTIVQKQLETSTSSTNKTTGEPDHSLVVKLADEIARIETNLSKMDKSVRGYKQLVQAKDRMINNVRANGYEIISLLGQEYNDGMQFQTRFVPDESLPEGKRIITGMIKMQVNYNGKMIQPAEIVVSQNI